MNFMTGRPASEAGPRFGSAGVAGGPIGERAATRLGCVSAFGSGHRVPAAANHAVPGTGRDEPGYPAAPDGAGTPEERPFFALPAVFEVADADLAPGAEGFDAEFSANRAAVHRCRIGQTQVPLGRIVVGAMQREGQERDRENSAQHAGL